MFNFKKQPYNLLLLTAVIILIASFFAFKGSLDMLLHDTYFVIDLSDIFRTVFFLLLIFWTLYLMTKRILFSKVLTWSHTILLVLTSISLVAIAFYSNYQGKAGMPGQYYDFGSWETIVQADGLPQGIALIFLAVILGLLMFIINLTIGVIKRFTGRKNIR